MKECRSGPFQGANTPPRGQDGAGRFEQPEGPPLCLTHHPTVCYPRPGSPLTTRKAHSHISSTLSCWDVSPFQSPFAICPSSSERKKGRKKKSPFSYLKGIVKTLSFVTPLHSPSKEPPDPRISHVDTSSCSLSISHYEKPTFGLWSGPNRSPAPIWALVLGE